jgi:S1-C subfamily serine protease
MQAAGLAPGDVVASVNGVSAASLAGDPARLAQSMGSGNARLEVLRGGNRISVSVPGR